MAFIRAEWNEAISSRRQAIVWRAIDVAVRHPVLDTLIQRGALDAFAKRSAGRA